MAETQQIPDNIPVSWLQKQISADADMLYLVSVPDSRTETQFMSKYFKQGDLCNALSSGFGIGVIRQWIDKLSGDYAPIIEGLSTNALCCATTPDPFIISAIYQSNGNIVELSGYRLSAGMEEVFNHTTFGTINAKNIRVQNLTADNISANNISANNISAINVRIQNLSVDNIVYDEPEFTAVSVVTKSQLASLTPKDRTLYFCTD